MLTCGLITSTWHQFLLYWLPLSPVQGVLSIPFSRFLACFESKLASGTRVGGESSCISGTKLPHHSTVYSSFIFSVNRFRMSSVLNNTDLFLVCFHLAARASWGLYYFPYFSLKITCGKWCYDVWGFFGGWDILICFSFQFLRPGEKVSCCFVFSVFSLQSFCSHILHFGKYAFMQLSISFKYIFTFFLL